MGGSRIILGCFLSRGIFLAAAFTLALLTLFTGPEVRYGDASDYVMMAGSIAEDGDLEYQQEDLDRILSIRPKSTDFPAGMFLSRDADAVNRLGGHSFYYPLAAAPFFLLFGVQGLQIFNALLWALSVYFVYIHFLPLGRARAMVFAFAGLWFTAAFDYIIWHTPATWMLFLGIGFIFCYQRGKSIYAGIFLGIAAGTQFPLILWAILPLIDLARRRRSFGEVFPLLFSAMLCFAPQLLYYRCVLDTWHPTWLDLASESRFLYYPFNFPGETAFSRAEHVVSFSRFSRASHFTFGDFLRAVFSPQLGLLWFYPFSIFALWRMLRERRGGAILITAMLILISFCTAGKLISHQVGLRYLNPIYPALLLGFNSFQRRRVERFLLILVVILGMTFAFYPRSNSVEKVREKKTIGAMLMR